MNNHSSKVSVSARSRAVKSPLSLPARIGALLLGLMLSSFALITPASAATITVGNAGDPVTGNAANCNVASTCTLRDSIAKAAAVTGGATGDTIVFSLPANTTITLSGNQLLVAKNLTIDGSAVSGLAISGDRQSRVFEITAGVTATLNQLTIEEGYVDEGRGGGIINSGILTLIDSTVANNTATLGGGGGIDNWDGVSLTLTGSTIAGNTAYIGGGIASRSGALTLTRSTVANNKATSNGGGGIFNTAGPLTLTNSTVKDNTAISGGGIENWGGATATLTDSTISGNFPGGIGNYYATMTLTDSVVSDNTNISDGGGISNNGIMMLTRSTVANNTAITRDFYGRGGGIHNSGTLTLTGSVVSGNTVSGNPATSASGGGIYNATGVTLTLIDSTISGNSAAADYGSGGGISNAGILTLTNCTVSGNTTGSHGLGGGIAGGALTLINSTVAGNTAGDHGGGIYTFGATLIHGTFANNTAAGSNSDIYNLNYLSPSLAVNTIIHRCEVDGSDTRALIDNGGNLDGGSGCGFTKASSKSNATIDLGALADNGGPTLTMLPGARSDAIGHGVRSVCDDPPVNGRDQRGYSRSTSTCTSGAVDPANNSINLNQHGLSGSWADPTANSQGLVMEIGPDFYGAGTGLLFAGWYTFDVSAAGAQRWYTLQAQVSGTTPASVGIYSSTGGRFDSPQATTTTEVGRATLAFSDCTHGTLAYTFNDGSDRSGRIPLKRLLSNTTCSPNGDSGSAAVPTLLSGAWADASGSGQGLVFDMNAADDVIFAGWYTYSPTGTSNDGAAGQRWYTLQATFEPGTSTPNSVGIYESTGGTFNAPANTQTTQVGTASLVFNSCASATLKYTFTGGASSGKNGTLDLTRVGAMPSGCHL